MVREEFDVLVVGAGSAGCTLTAWLAGSSALRIGLVEAGPDYGAASSGRWPPELLDARQAPKTHDWGFAHSRARVVGGCSAHNQCAIVRPAPGDFDRWAGAGASGWTDAALAPLIERVEQALGLHQYRDDELTLWQRAFFDGALAAGFTRVADPNDPGTAEAVAPFHANVHGSVRWNAAFAFLDPVRGGPHLTILDDTLVDRLVIEGGRATALIGHRRGEAVTLHGRRFVLCAGVYGSPAILTRSGIGAPLELARLGVPVRVPLPGVGENLHDHPGVAFDYEPTATARQQFEAELASGRLYSAQVNLKARADVARERDDLDVFPYQSPDDAGVWRFLVMAFSLAPRSRGHVRLASLDPAQPPHIDFRFLTDPAGHDAAALGAAVRLLNRLAAAAPLRDIITRELIPGRSLTGEQEVAEFLRAHLVGYAHPGGTCRIGQINDAGAVVGPDGRVHGIDNVFIADASIAPEIPRAPINLTCMVVGLRIAELLLESAGGAAPSDSLAEPRTP